MVMSNGAIHTFAQTGRDSPWGVLGTLAFWTLAAMSAQLALSCSRDAIRTRWRGVALNTPFALKLVVGGMILLGTVGLTVVLTQAALRRWDSATLWSRNGWIGWVMVLHFVAGIGMLMGGLGWRYVGWIVLLMGMLGAVVIGGNSMDVHPQPQQLFDRIWLIPPVWLAIVGSIWMLMSVGGMLLLGWLISLRPMSRRATAVPVGA